MAKTENGVRYYTCKICAAEVKEPMKSWKQKPQQEKNVCPWCINQRKVAAQTQKEMSLNQRYSLFGGGLWR